MDPFGDQHLREQADEKQMKEQYVQQYITDYGYDNNDFYTYLGY